MGQGGGRQLLNSVHLTSTLPSSSSSSSSSSSCRVPFGRFSTSIRLSRRSITSPRFGEEWFTDDEDEAVGGRQFQKSSNGTSGKFSNHRDFEHAFGEEILHSAGLEEITNRQLRRKPVGRSRALALFGTSKLHDPGDKSHLPRDSGKPRFRLHNLKRDESMMARYGILESVMKDIRTDREESLQRKRQRMEKERQLRARDQASFIQAKPSNGNEEEQGPTKPPSDEVKQPWSSVASERTEGDGAEKQKEGDEGPPVEATEATDDADAEKADSNKEVTITTKWSQELPSPRAMFGTGLASADIARPQTTTTLAPDFAGDSGPIVEHQLFRSRLESAASVEAALGAGAAHVAQSGVGLTAKEAVMLLASISRLSRTSGTPENFLPRLERLIKGLQTREGVSSLSPKELRDTLLAVVQLQAPFSGILRPLLMQLRTSSRSFETAQLVTVLFALSRLNDAAARSVDKECQDLMETISEVLEKRRAELASLKPLQVLTLCIARSRLQLRKPSLKTVVLATLRAETSKLTASGSSTLHTQDVAIIVTHLSKTGDLDEDIIEEVCRWWVQKQRGQPSTSELLDLCKSLASAPAQAKRLFAERLIKPSLVSKPRIAWTFEEEVELVCNLKDQRLMIEAVCRWGKESKLSALRPTDLARSSHCLSEVSVSRRHEEDGDDFDGGAAGRAKEYLAAEVAERVKSLGGGSSDDVLNLALASNGLAIDEGTLDKLLAASTSSSVVTPTSSARLLLALHSAVPSLTFEDTKKLSDGFRNASTEDFQQLTIREGVSLLCLMCDLQDNRESPREVYAQDRMGSSRGEWTHLLAASLVERLATSPNWKLDIDDLAFCLDEIIINFDKMKHQVGPSSTQLFRAFFVRLPALLANRSEASSSMLSKVAMSQSLDLIAEVRSSIRASESSQQIEERMLQAEVSTSELALHLASLGCDGLATRRWLQRRLEKGDRPSSELCDLAFLCASNQINASAALACAERVMEDAPSGSPCTPRSLIKLAWAVAVAGGETNLLLPLLQATDQINPSSSSSSSSSPSPPAEDVSALEQLAQEQLRSYLEATQAGAAVAWAALPKQLEESSGPDQNQTTLRRRRALQKALQQLDVFFEVRSEALLLPDAKLALLCSNSNVQALNLLSGSASGFSAIPKRLLEGEGWRNLDLPNIQEHDDLIVELAKRLAIAAPAHYADLPGSTAVTRIGAGGTLPASSTTSSPKMGGQKKSSRTTRGSTRKRH